MAPLIVYWFIKQRVLLIGLFLTSVLASSLIPALQVSHSYLVWLGIEPAHFTSLDHSSIPWLSVYLIGVFMGLWAFKKGDRQLKPPDVSQIQPARGLIILGQNTLLLYLVHQPIILAVFAAMGIL